MNYRRGDEKLDESTRKAFKMCRSKKKFKSSTASMYAARWGQRKYECPICGHWHLTKLKGEK